VAKQAFLLRSQEIIDGWLERRKNFEGSEESANAWFKREAYALLRHYVDRELTSVFAQTIRADSRSAKLTDDAVDNPYKQGLLAMFSDESLSRSDRHVFGNQMLYADRHDVPSEFLNGFLAMSGGPSVIAEKLKNGFVQPGFERRVERAARRARRG